MGLDFNANVKFTSSDSTSINKANYTNKSEHTKEIGFINFTTTEARKSTKELGLELLGKNTISYNPNITKTQNKEVANETNAILKELGYNYKVSPAQVESVRKEINSIQKDINYTTVSSNLRQVDKNDIEGQEFSKLFAAE